MSEPEWRIRVMYYLPCDPKPSLRKPPYSTKTAYLDVLGLFRRNDLIKGYSRTQAHGFWRDPDTGDVYLSKVQVIAVDYSGLDDALVNRHVESMKDLINRVYDQHGVHQLSIYIVSVDVLGH